MIHERFCLVDMMIILLIMLAGISSILGRSSLQYPSLEIQTVHMEGSAISKPLATSHGRMTNLTLIKDDYSAKKSNEITDSTQISKQSAENENSNEKASLKQTQKTDDLTLISNNYSVGTGDKTTEYIQRGAVLVEPQKVETADLTLMSDDYSASRNNTTNYIQVSEQSTGENSTERSPLKQVPNATDLTLMSNDFSAGADDQTTEYIQRGNILVEPQIVESADFNVMGGNYTVSTNRTTDFTLTKKETAETKNNVKRVPTAQAIEATALTPIQDAYPSDTSNETTELNTRAPPICEPLYRCISSCLSSMRLRRQNSESERHRRDERDLEMGSLMRAAPPQRPLAETLPQPPPQAPRMWQSQAPRQTQGRPPPAPRQPPPGHAVRPSMRNIYDEKSKPPNVEIL